MREQVVNIGDKVEMYRISAQADENEVRRQYISQVLDYTEEDQIKLAMPMEGSRMVPLTIGDLYEVCFYTSAGLFQAQLEIVDRYKENNIFMLVGEFQSDLEKCQRRQYYRLEKIIDIDYRNYTREEEILERRLRMNDFANEEARLSCKKILNEVKSKWILATITDISGGGARFNSFNLHKPGSLLYLRIPIEKNEDTKIYEFKAEVVKSNILPKRTDFYETRVKFVDIDRDEREQIVRFIFEQERKMLRKGVL
ncbi:MAG: flagellar brake protein [Lachnospiraceae bacterium]|nr:flagellar brake protein [Lachnospiraceae bacterium]